MITIEKQGSYFVFTVNGMHKLWTLKSQLTIPLEHIIDARQDTENIGSWKGWKAPGLSIPSIITAGTFYRDGDKIFWDVTNIENCIIVDLKDEDYKQLVIEVENPEAALKVLAGG